MSSRSRRRKDTKKGKPTPRRSAQQTTSGAPDSLFAEMMRGARGLVAVRSPLDGELIVSELLGTWWGYRLLDTDIEQVMGYGLVDHAERSGTPAALALLRGITHLGTPDQAERAKIAAERLSESGVRPPPWTALLDAVQPEESWIETDGYGDQDSIICVFSYAGDEHHALVVLVDHNLAGMAKDVWVTSEVERLLEYCRREAHQDAMRDFEPISLDRARAVLQSAIDATDADRKPPVSETFPSYHALLRTRIATLPPGAKPVSPPRWSRDRRAALAAEFLAAEEAKDLSDTTAASRCADRIIEYGCDQDQGRPLRVSPLKATLFLLDWLPRKIVLSPADREAMPHVLSAWVRWATRKTGLSEVGVLATLDAVWEASRKFEETYGDPEALGLDSETSARLLPDGDLEALPRRAFAVTLLTGDYDGVDLSLLDPADPDERRMLIEAEHSDDGQLSDPDVNPDLHIATHEIVATQLWNDDPPETWETARRLLDLGYERHDVLHMLCTAVSRSVRQVLSGESYQPDQFRAALDDLPDWWENLRESES